jgi:hypothetical protein
VSILTSITTEGFHDINEARVEAAHRYLSRVDSIFIISNISRAVSDPTIQQILREHVNTAGGISRRSVPDVVIICTFSAVRHHPSFPPLQLSDT